MRLVLRTEDANRVGNEKDRGRNEKDRGRNEKDRTAGMK
jgi:hypothetical protein